MDVILIGNSNTVLDYELGSVIDNYDVVARFNNFETKGFEEQVGTKTTWHLRRACDDIYFPEANHTFCFVTYCKLTPGMRRVAQQVKGHLGDKCTVVDVGICGKVGEMAGLNQPKERASVGLLAIGFLLNFYHPKIDKLILHGFFEDEVDITRKKHYFKKPPKDDRYHNWNKEKEYILKLREEGRVEFLKYV